MWKEFKSFISKGSILATAIGMIIGASFTNVINSLVADILTPLLSFLTGGVNFSDWVVHAGPMAFKIGNFVNAIISFLIVSFILFLISRTVNGMEERLRTTEKEKPTTKTCPFCQSTIDIKASRCPHCTSELPLPARAAEKE